MINDLKFKVPNRKDDPRGYEAFRLGASYYTKAMTCVDAKDHQKRIECFRAAELLYLNAAERGNIDAILSLGYVYSYDRCEGQYSSEGLFFDVEEADQGKVDHKRRAFECFSAAAKYDIPEALYKLGDMYQKGMGCEEDPEQAFSCFYRALAESSPYDVYGRSGAALRLASCYENGYGCEPCAERALRYYEEAGMLFGRILNDGDWFYEKSHAAAQAGVRRMRQELSLG